MAKMIMAPPPPPCAFVPRPGGWCMAAADVVAVATREAERDWAEAGGDRDAAAGPAVTGPGTHPAGVAEWRLPLPFRASDCATGRGQTERARTAG